MDANDVTDRLTEREKEVLRLWLQHRTAKEIAIDLGISHHAVEKRLKMARTKLDAGSSLEAARMLAQNEGYGQAVPRLPDLETPAQSGKQWRTRHLVTGAATMSILSAAAIILFSHSGTAEMALKPGDLLLVAPVTFEQLDTDRSGYLEGNEAPPLIRASGNPTYTPNGNGTAELAGDAFQIDTGALRDGFYAQADTDGDGRISPREYATWAKPAQREIKIENNLEPIFDKLDANGSGYLESPESPFIDLALLDPAFPVEAGQDHNGNAVLGDGTDPAQVAEFYAASDTDDDGRVSFREYYTWSEARLAELGVEVSSVLKALPAPKS
ncbi:LuxR C-terminal-related transcriptional regulator [Porphyrobacter sp. ULC335]|jgi:DNA-binding CsgD family transcriptional regulator|uniref:LuxR C-terminal-related transcriptional regulator n=1 Tax=Porphyrobacter sp. ULC335 TaxID=2854260 RepID=UPI00221F3B2F|nr:LuxR C-terminal-related transcriptional regulator [Porphyrobacter sp. ULC335]UYV14556.1 LuxR C-terminal-related transcriptional regulator [Porphyrobacter sp. ULC335]